MEIAGIARRTALSMALAAALVLSPGCGTVYQGKQEKGPAIFGGIRLDLQQMSHEKSGVGDMVFYCLDMPFSLCFDAVLLLFSAINEAYEGGIDVHAQHPDTLDEPVDVR